MTSLVGISLLLGACTVEESRLDSPSRSALVDENGDFYHNIPSLYGTKMHSLGAVSGSMQLSAQDSCLDRDMDVPHQALLGDACRLRVVQQDKIMGLNGGDLDEDGLLTCDDGGDDSQSGLLFKVLCHESVVDRAGVREYSAELQSTEQFVSASFSDYNAFDTVNAMGFWTAGSRLVYPMNLRVWAGPNMAELKPSLSLSMASMDAGQFRFDLAGLGIDLRGENEFRYSATPDCVEQLNDVNCTLSANRVAGSDLLEGAIKQAATRFISDHPQAPTQMAMEAWIDYGTDKVFRYHDEELSPRSVYLQAAQLGDYLWVKVQFLSDDGSELAIPSESRYFSALQGGFCHDLTEVQYNLDCSNFPVRESAFRDLYAGYSQLSQGREQLSSSDTFQQSKPRQVLGVETID
ncbi:hypothetical protein [Pseudobacteriovorax antillogorgiicola]|nr:hypothetical protein [Pseudobacteriovorax antillogorgiicola]